MALRNLSSNEIAILKKQGCTARDWQNIRVKDPFNSAKIRNVYFAGKVEIGNDCLITNVAKLSNYTIADHVTIENCQSVFCEGESGFGNGVELDVLNEGGGRTLTIFDHLSSQIAYLMVNYRHEKTFISKLEKLIGDYVESKKSRQGYIGSYSEIRNSGIIRNVSFGEYAVIDNVVRLEDGTVASTKAAPVFVGDAVIAKEFIILSGSKVDGGALIDRCFIGQGVKIGKQYSAENSVFFANCEGFHGEACSLFGGPYTVTHHKSTLLIAGLFSFYNAGSGTNQSNHMYKLGPIHQGVLERGSKTGSFSYMLWPSRVGAFSVVTGKHTSNFDASDFPFSYITEEGGKPQLTPAMNLFTVGTRRDSAKWPARDRRKDPVKYDLIHFDLFNPYTVGKMVKAVALLQDLAENTAKKQEYAHYKGCYIKRLMLRTCSKYYEMAIKIYIGQELLKRIDGLKSFNEIKSKLFSGKIQADDWKDISGMLVSESTLEKLISDVNSGNISSTDDLSKKLQKTYEDYDQKSWQWTCHLIADRLGTELKDISNDQVKSLVSDWENASVKFNNMILKDASKEFDRNSMIAYGIDSTDEAVIAADFEAVRGDYDGNSFVKGLISENENISMKAKKILTILA
ncbi:MAG: DUF4954 family protein [Candidatus Marinimicrobia bacterium]|nr:DUF4954 family protein [Candidatus Neomarinimicrobiota bacterium]RKY57782.1 MAG: DUF4954 domain-containing protein [Candidatus Neomarinimicrobiota bacterium]